MHTHIYVNHSYVNHIYCTNIYFTQYIHHYIYIHTPYNIYIYIHHYIPHYIYHYIHIFMYTIIYIYVFTIYLYSIHNNNNDTDNDAISITGVSHHWVQVAGRARGMGTGSAFVWGLVVKCTGFSDIYIYMGLSENSVPHCTQWLMIIIPIKWL